MESDMVAILDEIRGDIVTRPPILTIGKCNYRVNTSGKDFGEQDNALEDTNMADDTVMEDLTELSDGSFLATVSASGQFYGKIIGKGGQTKQRLEQETGAKINIPRKGQSGNITIKGQDPRAVASCKTRVELLILEARQHAPITHFLSIPIQGAEFADSIDRFRDTAMEIQNSEGDIGLSQEMFNTSTKLHLTIGVLKLFDQQDINKAKQVLQECAKKLKGLRGTKIIVKGVEYMNDDPAAVDVLYAKVSLDDGPERLQVAVNEIADAFVDAGLLDSENENVKLHATVINSKWMRNKRANARKTFNASKLLVKFKKYEFGQSLLNAIHIEKMAKVDASGHYQSEYVLNL
eukprot:m.282861 g.282861  ORF g.282861 m.282861 type:complete len:349 (+) comp16338_c2_seq25:3397-4443(+)